MKKHFLVIWPFFVIMFCYPLIFNFFYNVLTCLTKLMTLATTKVAVKNYLLLQLVVENGKKITKLTLMEKLCLVNFFKFY